jgi:membrane peptidoglycan carboxypeptidase
MVNNKPKKPEQPRARKALKSNVHVTKSGKTIKLHQSLADKIKSRKEEMALKKAERMRDMPKSRIKRFFYRLHPKRMYKYWFSREGGIMALKVTGIGLVVLFITVIGVFAYFRKDLPNLRDISGDNIGGSIRYYDSTGETLLWEDYDAVKRIPVESDQISQYVKDATIAIEDRDFYKHGGFDLKGITRAAVANITGGGTSQGGSTITQQLVKLTQDWTKDRSYTRKIKEVILSVELERSYTKDEILTGYLNAAPYGNIEYGVEAGARDYFQKSAKDLTLAEAAFLAAIPRSPSYYSPYGPYFDKTLLKGRMDYVLNVMAEMGKITKKQRDEAKKVDVLASVKKQPPKYGAITAPYFVLAAKQQLQNMLASQQSYNLGGWKVITSLDLSLQRKAEELVENNRASVNRLTRGTADEQATVLEDIKTGQIKALVGGVDFSDPDHGQNNYAAGILIPPGSSFKPYDYATFIENNTNAGAGTVLYDTQGPLPGYPCTNKNSPKSDDNANCLWDYDFNYPGPVTLRYALGGSRNVPAVKAMLSAVPNDTSANKVNSINKVIKTASDMMNNPYIKGSAYNCYADEELKTTTQCYGASAIGDGAFLHLDDHVNGLGTFGRMGQTITKTYILKITNGEGKVNYQWTQPQNKQVLRPDTAYIINDMASDPNASYLPGSCDANNCRPLSSGGYKFHVSNGWNFAIKTGTTNDGFDGLMSSWSSNYAVVTWVGNHFRNVNIQQYGASMEQLTAPVTRGLMEAAHAGKPAVNWTKPAGVKTLPAFVIRSKVSRLYESIPSPSTDLFPSWYQSKSLGNNTKQTIDVISNKLATECTPDLAKKELDNSDATSFSGDAFTGAGSANTNQKDDVHQCTDARPSIDIASVSASGNQITITANIAQGTHPLAGNGDKGGGKVNFIVGGQTAQSQDVNDSTSTYTYSYVPSTSGQTISVQVVDSVLYDGTDSYPNAVAPISLTITPQGGGFKYSWSGATGSVTIIKESGGNVCTGVGSCNAGSGIANTGTRVYAKDLSGYISPTVTVGG